MSELYLDHPYVNSTKLTDMRKIRSRIAFQCELAIQLECKIMVIDLGEALNYEIVSWNAYLNDYIHYSKLYSGNDLHKIVLVYDDGEADTVELSNSDESLD